MPVARYTRPEMAEIWSDRSKYRIWYEIEAAACDALAVIGAIPPEVPKAVWAVKDVEFDLDEIAQIEAEVKHDVIAFLTHLGQHVGPLSRYIHQGLTSSDVLDTTLAVQLTRATDLLVAGVDRLCKALKTRAFEHRLTVCVGRSHGVHAEPTTFGLKLAQAYAEFDRGRARLLAARSEIATAKVSGAVGTFANVSPQVEAHVAAHFGLSPEPISTQVIPRDRHAAYFSALAVVASSLERLAVEIRHLQRTEVREAEEAFTVGQKGSSAMPHKRNPVLSENVTGLARLIRAAAGAALENVALWHERDISHSAVERAIAPDATTHLHFALHRMAGVIEGLVVYPDRMRANLDSLGGLHASQAVLLALTQAGFSREDAYAAVQAHAMAVWRDGGQLQDRLLADPAVRAALGPETIAACFAIDHHLAAVDLIFARVFGEGEGR